MKTEWTFRTFRPLLIALALAVTTTSSTADMVVYCARVRSTSATAWDPPFWWISAGGDTYGTSTSQSTAPGTPTRLGSYYRTVDALFFGEGFGVVCSNCSVGPNFVYQVEITQPHYQLNTDAIFGVCSTNCAIGGLSGGAGSPTNTTAFQAAYSADKWAFVCWLTNTAGVPNPEIEFHYVSGTGPGTSRHHFADCVRFIQICCSGAPAPVQITGVGGASVAYSGGDGTRFILLKSANLGAALGSWDRVGTNYSTPGLFTIPSMGTGATAFYRIQSE